VNEEGSKSYAKQTLKTILLDNGSVTFNLELIALKIWLVSLLAIS